jgi:cell division ATPase FtsA
MRQSAGLDVDDIVLEQLASSEAVESGRKGLGVAISTSEEEQRISSSSNGSIKHTGHLFPAGSHITHDIRSASGRRRRGRKDQDPLRMQPAFSCPEG